MALAKHPVFRAVLTAALLEAASEMKAVYNDSLLDSAFAQVNVSDLAFRDKGDKHSVAECMPLSRSSPAPWPEFMVAQMEHSYAHPPLARTRCPRPRTDCLVSTTAVVFADAGGVDGAARVVHSLLTEVPATLVRRVVIVVVEGAWGMPHIPRHHLNATALGERIAGGKPAVFACDCAVDRLYETGDARLVVLCETRDRAALVRAAYAARTASMLLVDATATARQSERPSGVDQSTRQRWALLARDGTPLEILFDRGLRTHLSHPYQACTFALGDNSSAVPAVFAPTVSVLAFGRGGPAGPGGHGLPYLPAHLSRLSGLPVVAAFDDDDDVVEAPTDSVVNVVWAADARDCVGLVASVASTLETSADPSRLALHIVAVDNATTLLERALNCTLADTPRRPHSLSVYPFASKPDDSTNARAVHGKGHARLTSDANFLRFDLDAILPSSVERVVWIDADTIVRADIALLLAEFEAQQRASPDRPLPVGAALRDSRDFIQQCCHAISWPKRLKAIVGNRTGSCGFNAGVMVYDLNLWRSTGLKERVKKWIDLDRLIGPLWSGGSQPPLLLATRNTGFATLHRDWNVPRFGTSRADPPHVAPGNLCGGARRPRLPAQLANHRALSGSGGDILKDPQELGRAATTARILHWTGHSKPWSPDSKINRYLWVDYGLSAERCVTNAFRSLGLPNPSY